MQSVQIKSDSIVMVDIDSIRQHPKNRNTHPQDQIDRLAKVISYQGFRDPLIVSKRSGLLISGHGRVLAAKQLGMNQVPVTMQDFEDDAQEYAALVSENAVASWAELDLSGINADIGDLGPEFAIDLLGIKGFVVVPEEKLPPGDPDSIPSAPKEAVTRRGDIWRLGKHRLMCGDATMLGDVDALMAGATADMIFTDPPYGIGYEYAKHDDSDPEANKQLVQDVFNLHEGAGKVWTPGLMNLARDIDRFGKTKVIVWHKKFAMAGNGIGGASTWEPVLVLNPTKKELANDVLVIRTEREFVNGKNLRSLHSCPKPVALFEELLDALSQEKDLIFEPFCGSGTTLIACEKGGRRCFGMEMDPSYCDVIVARWEQYTGRKAELLTPTEAVANG